MQINTVTNIKIRRISASFSLSTDDQLAIEEPLEIQLSYGFGENYLMKTISVTMRTPGNDEELAAGFLFTEGILKNQDEVQQVSKSVLGCNRILVTLEP